MSIDGAVAPAYVHVLLDVANRRLDQIYTYTLPPEMTVAAGMTVLVPLKNRQVRGMVVSVSDVLPGEAADAMLRPIVRVVQGENVLSAELLDLACWLARSVMCPIAQSLHAVWPFWRQKIEKWAVPLVRAEDVADWRESEPDGFLAMRVLLRARRGGLPVSVFMARLREQGFLGDGDELTKRLAQWGVLAWEIRVAGENKGPEKNRVSRGVSEQSVAVQEKTKAMQEDLARRLFAQLSPEQREAAEGILAGLDQGEGRSVLLHGVTGSGKTMVYRAVVAEVVARGREAVVLVPEISLTSQVARYFLEDYGDKAAVVHSKLSLRAKQRIWADILAGYIKVVIGARSAVFAPFSALGVIVMDEEHDGAYQQDDNPKYHTRNVARWRVRSSGGVLVLGSATPSIESYAAAVSGRIDLVELKTRFSLRPLPRVLMVNMAQEFAQGNKGIFSQALLEKIGARLQREEQCILFLNRRGYATYVSCRECGFVAKCPNCDVALTYHSHSQVLLCHYCGHRAQVEHHCPACGSVYLKFFGLGTQRLQEEISSCFPAARVLRLDTDAAERGGQNVSIVESFRELEADILVGTQMLAKGLDFPKVTLVGVVLADALLNMPDFRARERTFQLLTQVAGRAGRHDRLGEVVLQTYMPRDEVLLDVAAYDYQSFFRDEISFRHAAQYPPFAHFLRLTVFHESEERVVKAARELAAAVLGVVEGEGESVKGEDIRILGPAPAALSKLRNAYRWQILMKGKQLDLLRKTAQEGIERFYQSAAGVSGVALNVEVNPLY